MERSPANMPSGGLNPYNTASWAFLAVAEQIVEFDPKQAAKLVGPSNWPFAGADHERDRQVQAVG